MCRCRLSPGSLASAALLSLGLLLASCATAPPAVAPAPLAVWQAHRSAVEALQQWQLSGRIAVRSGEDGWSASFDWQQRGEHYRIRLRGPFGQGGVELHGDASGVWLERADQPPVFARDADTLLEQQTGWRLPVGGLAAWLRGLPAAGGDDGLRWDQQGRLLELRQQGWQIDYGRYGRVAGIALPQKLRLRRDALQVKLVIDKWQLS